MRPAQAINPKLFVVLLHLGGVAVVALLLALVYLLAFRPMVLSQEADAQRADQVEQLLTGSLQVRREHMQLTQDLEELTKRVRGSRELTPDTAMEAVFLSQATQIARDEGVEIEDFRRGKVRYLNSHSELEITLTGAGPHAGICKFLDRMQTLPRATQVRKLSINTSDDPLVYPLEVAFTLYFDLRDENTLAQLPGR